MPRNKKKTSKKSKRKSKKKDNLSNILDQFSKYGPVFLEEREFTPKQLSRTSESQKKREKSAKKIQSRLRGNITRRKVNKFPDTLLSVPYRGTDWKGMEDFELPINVEEKILKSIIHPEIDNIVEDIEELEKEYITVPKELKGSVMAKIEESERKLKKFKQLNIFQCRSISKLLRADPRLVLTKSYKDDIKNLITPCRTLDISIYINTLYTLPWELYHPWRPQAPGDTHSIYSKIESFPDEIFTNYGKSMLRKTLEDLGLMHEKIRHADKFDRETDKYHRYHDGHMESDRLRIRGGMTRFELLANYYRWSNYERGVDLLHLKNGFYDNPYTGQRLFPHLIAGRADGRRDLELTLELFEQNIRSRELVESFPMVNPNDPHPVKSSYGGPSGISVQEGRAMGLNIVVAPIPFPEEYDVGQKVKKDYLDDQIKRMKIHFIYALIGMDDRYNYYDLIRKKVDELKKSLPEDVEGEKLWEKYDTKGRRKNISFLKKEEKVKEYEFILDNLLD